jgi:hypothetical protein
MAADSVLPTYLNFFQTQPKVHSIDGGFTTNVLPLASVSSSSSVVEFIIPNLQQCLISLKDTLVYLKFKIVAADGANLVEIAVETDEYFTILNSSATSIIQDVHVLINGKFVSSSNNLYPFVGHIQNLVSDLNYKRFEFFSRGFIEEAADDGKTASSASGVARHAKVAKSSSLELISPIVNGIFGESQLLAPNVELGLRFFPAKSSFFIFNKKNKSYSLILESMHLKVKYVKLDPEFLIKTIEHMKHNDFTLPHLKIQPKSIVIPSGISTITLANIINGPMPAKMYFTFVTNKSVLGTFDTNPLNFQAFDLSSYEFKINEKSYPSSEIEFSLKSGNYIELYNHVMRNINSSAHSSPGISYKAYKSGTFFILENFVDDDGHPFYSKKVHGNMNLSLTFETQLTEAISIILLPVYANTLSINQQGDANILDL